jgi:hypothetical protein
MDLVIENNRVRTTSDYDVRMIRALPKLEGTKRWASGKVFTFENTPYNLEVWRSVFPNAKIKNESTPAAPTEATKGHKVFEEPRPTFAFKTPPRAHQKRALEKLFNKKEFPESFGLFMDIGTGKSWTGIAAMGIRWCDGLSDHVLLIAKNGVHAQWVNEQIPQHMSEVVPWKAWIWNKTKKGNREFDAMMAFDGLKIFAINIDALITPAAEEKILQFLKVAKGRATMIVDESQDIKNITASRTKAAIKFGSLCKYRMIMTGTPLAKNLVDAFSQFKFLDERIFGHRYVTTFRSRYCLMRDNGFGLEIVGHKNVEEFYRKIEPHIFRINADEVLDLPPKVYIQQPFTLAEEQKRLLKDLRTTFMTETEKGARVSVPNAAALVTRMQQISCGFVVDENGVVRELPNPRLKELLNVLEQRSGKAIIWCRFNEDIKRVMKVLGPLAVDYYGGTPTNDRAKNVAAFLDPGSSVSYLVASPEAAGTGLNLQGVCRTNIYYSNSFNSLARWQSEGRTWRDGTTGSVTYIDLVAKGSPDARILKNLQDKKSISDLALDEYRKLILMEENDEILEA